MNFNNALGVHADAVRLRAHRAEMLAGNLANAETPNYKARDIDFASVLKGETLGHISMRRTNAAHVLEAEAAILGAEILYRNPGQPSLDGNTVDTQTEQAEFTSNTVMYLASLRFLNGKISSLMTAIRGE